MAGSVEILNVQGGDVKISFDKADLQETIRAKRIVSEMLRRGYALVVEVERNGERAYERVQKFDENRGEYIIADLDEGSAEESPNATPAKRRGRASKRIPMEGARATAVARSAGG